MTFLDGRPEDFFSIWPATTGPAPIRKTWHWWTGEEPRQGKMPQAAVGPISDKRSQAGAQNS